MAVAKTLDVSLSDKTSSVDFVHITAVTSGCILNHLEVRM